MEEEQVHDGWRAVKNADCSAATEQDEGFDCRTMLLPDPDWVSQNTGSEEVVRVLHVDCQEGLVRSSGAGCLLTDVEGCAGKL